MVSQFSAQTRHLGKYEKYFNSSYLIKLFTNWEIKPEVREYFKLGDIHDCPTHAWKRGEKSISGKWIILEADVRNWLNYEYYPCRVFDYRSGSDYELFEKLRKESHGKVYAIWQWFNFIRRALLWWIFGRDNLKSKQLFTKFWVCSEICYDDMKNHSDDYDYPVLSGILSKINKNVYSPAQMYNTLYSAIKAGEMEEVENG